MYENQGSSLITKYKPCIVLCRSVSQEGRNDSSGIYSGVSEATCEQNKQYLATLDHMQVC